MSLNRMLIFFRIFKNAEFLINHAGKNIICFYERTQFRENHVDNQIFFCNQRRKDFLVAPSTVDNTSMNPNYSIHM